MTTAKKFLGLPCQSCSAAQMHEDARLVPFPCLGAYRELCKIGRLGFRGSRGVEFEGEESASPPAKIPGSSRPPCIHTGLDANPFEPRCSGCVMRSLLRKCTHVPDPYRPPAGAGGALVAVMGGAWDCRSAAVSSFHGCPQAFLGCATIAYACTHLVLLGQKHSRNTFRHIQNLQSLLFGSCHEACVQRGPGREVSGRTLPLGCCSRNRWFCR